MTRFINHNGKKTAVINMFIDPENGFLNPMLKPEQGGSLYVPNGEQVAPLMGDIISQTSNGIFVIGQDYHPANHISFAANHPGVMEYRIGKYKNLLAAEGQNVPANDADLYLSAQQPVHFFNGFDKPPAFFPFEEIVLDGDRNIIGLKEEDGRIRNVEVETTSGLAPSPKDRGRVSKVLDTYFDKTFDEMRASGQQVSTQTLWTEHCIQGTESCKYPDAMKLPEGLTRKLYGDMMSKSIYHRDAASGNEFHVIRKGNRSEVDSYGIGVENDGETMTPAWEVFRDIASKLKSEGCEQVIVNVGGLASNFCVEFSANNMADFLAGHFKMRGMDAEVNYVPEISRGIPIPGGAEVPFSEAGAPVRMQQTRGIRSVSLAEVLDQQKPGKRSSGVLQLAGGRDQQVAVG
jgi:nicotinamidase-related amidase